MRVDLTCSMCGNVFSVWPSKANARFCSTTCSGQNQSTPVESRFWHKVDKNGPIPVHCPELGPCWIWTGCRDYHGYGYIVVNRKQRGAHVVAYILTTGHEPPAETPFITHLCDNGELGCVRPSHLKADTHAGNMNGMKERGRSARGSRQGLSKLTEEDVLKIRASYAAGGVTMRGLATLYGVCKANIEAVINRKTWHHV